jgi:hypothetical protein
LYVVSEHILVRILLFLVRHSRVKIISILLC